MIHIADQNHTDWLLAKTRLVAMIPLQPCQVWRPLTRTLNFESNVCEYFIITVDRKVSFLWTSRYHLDMVTPAHLATNLNWIARENCFLYLYCSGNFSTGKRKTSRSIMFQLLRFLPYCLFCFDVSKQNYQKCLKKQSRLLLKKMMKRVFIWQ